MVTYDDFKKLDIRVGKIVSLEDFPEAKKPSYKLKIDFGGEIGTKVSSAQLVKHYTKEQLQGKLVLGVVNFPPRQVVLLYQKFSPWAFLMKTTSVFLLSQTMTRLR